VKAYREKLASVDESVTAAMSRLDQDLEEFLRDLKTPVPSAPPEPEGQR